MAKPLFTHKPLGHFARLLIGGHMNRKTYADLIAAIRENPDVDCATGSDERELKGAIYAALPPAVREKVQGSNGLCMWFSPRLATCIAMGDAISYAAKPDIVFEPGTDINDIVAYLCMVA